MTTHPQPSTPPPGDPRVADGRARPLTDLGAEAAVAPESLPAPSLADRIRALWCAFVSGLG